MPKASPRPVTGAKRIELVISAGLEPIAREELRQLGAAVRLDPAQTSGLITMGYVGDLRALINLRTVQSAYIVRNFAVPRPKALLGDEHFRASMAMIDQVRNLHPAGSFKSFFLSAAGADSAVLTRFKSEIAARSKLEVGSEDGDLFLRLRKSTQGEGWDLMVRLSPRPLATRPWRVCNMEGALNGAVAHAMVRLTRPSANDRYLNLGCGSGSLLIERLLAGPARQVFGCDIDPMALACARANIGAAGLTNRCELHEWDARSLPLPDASIDVISADLPFGHLVGSHDDNLELYPALLAEAARVARPEARCVLLSHEVRLMERLLSGQKSWELSEAIRIDLGGLYPRIFLLRRRAKP